MHARTRTHMKACTHTHTQSACMHEQTHVPSTSDNKDPVTKCPRVKQGWGGGEVWGVEETNRVKTGIIQTAFRCSLHTCLHERNLPPRFNFILIWLPEHKKLTRHVYLHSMSMTAKQYRSSTCLNFLQMPCLITVNEQASRQTMKLSRTTTLKSYTKAHWLGTFHKTEPADFSQQFQFGVPLAKLQPSYTGWRALLGTLHQPQIKNGPSWRFFVPTCTQHV